MIPEHLIELCSGVGRNIPVYESLFGSIKYTGVEKDKAICEAARQRWKCKETAEMVQKSALEYLKELVVAGGLQNTLIVDQWGLNYTFEQQEEDGLEEFIGYIEEILKESRNTCILLFVAFEKEEDRLDEMKSIARSRLSRLESFRVQGGDFLKGTWFSSKWVLF